jgi:hypothetical protein
MKIRPVGAEGRTDRRTSGQKDAQSGMTKPTVAIRLKIHNSFDNHNKNFMQHRTASVTDDI